MEDCQPLSIHMLVSVLLLLCNISVSNLYESSFENLLSWNNTVLKILHFCYCLTHVYITWLLPPDANDACMCHHSWQWILFLLTTVVFILRFGLYEHGFFSTSLLFVSLEIMGDKTDDSCNSPSCSL
jgi:hypothetical protein